VRGKSTRPTLMRSVGLCSGGHHVLAVSWVDFPLTRADTAGATSRRPLGSLEGEVESGGPPEVPVCTDPRSPVASGRPVVDEPIKLTRFEQELIRHLRALPFSLQQHVSRYILRLQREEGRIPRDPAAAEGLGELGPPEWKLTKDELARMRAESEEDAGRPDE